MESLRAENEELRSALSALGVRIYEIEGRIADDAQQIKALNAKLATFQTLSRQFQKIQESVKEARLNASENPRGQADVEKAERSTKTWMGELLKQVGALTEKSDNPNGETESTADDLQREATKKTEMAAELESLAAKARNADEQLARARDGTRKAEISVELRRVEEKVALAEARLSKARVEAAAMLDTDMVG